MKTYQQFISEAVSKSDKLTGRLKMLYNLPKDSDKYFKQQNPPEVDRLKKAQGETLKQGNTYLAQIVPTKSNNPIDTRTTEEKGKNVKGKAYTAKMTNTWDRFKGP